MTKKEYARRKAEIVETYRQGKADEAVDAAIALVGELHQDKDYALVVDLFHSPDVDPKGYLWTFEVAYALNEMKLYPEAEEIYEQIVDLEPENSAALNNLSNIKKTKEQTDEAFSLIKRAYEINPKDEIILRNYEALLSIVRERDEREKFYKQALDILPKENEFVIQKLSSFFLSARNDPDYRNNCLPIPRWKVKVMMGTDDQKAQSLLQQWLDKGYLRKTGTRGDYNELRYELNPFIFAELPKLKPKKLNPLWIQGLEQLNADALDALGYFRTQDRVARVKKSIRGVLQRDVDELFLNYVVKNYKSVVILSGSIVEMLLMYYCEKKHVADITYQRHSNNITKPLYETDLGDLLAFFEEHKLLGDVVVHMGNISRIYRNFVHPGRELREQVVLDQPKADLCFVSTLEILNKVCT